MTMADRIAVMNAGRIEQLAVPGELYDEPATAFVADFIGEMSVLEGKLAGDDVRLADGGRIPTGRRLEDVANGASVSVGLRPEAARLRPAGEEADADATVIAAMVLGDRLQVVARLCDDQELLLRQGRSADDGDFAAVQPGERVGLSFRPGAGLLLGQNGAPRTSTGRPATAR